MTKLVVFSISLLMTVLFNLGLGYPSAILARDQQPTQQNVVPIVYPLPGGSDELRLTSSSVVTIYLPRIIKPALSSKKGVGVIASPACADLRTLRATWYINWRHSPDPTCAPADRVKFVPRISDAAAMQKLPQAIANARASGWLIGFNEPNLPQMANLSPAQGAILWKQIEDAALPAGIKLVSPTPNPWGPGVNGQPYGHQWTWFMVHEYRLRYGHIPHFDALSWNVYEKTGPEMISFLVQRRTEAVNRGYQVPFWILEYSGNYCIGTVAENYLTMSTVTPWLENTPWIGRYAWFANRITGLEPGLERFRSCTLIDPATGNATMLGRVYSGY